MLSNIVPRKTEYENEYELVFDDGHNNGLGFPCDENGKVPDDLNPAAKRNLAFALEHPEKYKRFNEVVCYPRRHTTPAHGKCVCGREVYLVDEYEGACKCDCGRWYNLFGQELNPPSQWEEEDYEDDFTTGYSGTEVHYDHW